MVEIDKISFLNRKNELLTNLCYLDKNDIQNVREFILKQHERLERKDFFIIEDLDTELPLIFEKSNGAIYGIYLGTQLVAIQAIDFSSENSSRLRLIVQSYLKDDFPLYEMGWTLVDSRFRGYHIAKYLVQYIENMISGRNCILVATVHPENIRALALYMKMGYKGYNIGEYYGYRRMFLIKSPLHREVILKKHIEYSELTKIQEALNHHFLCENIVELGGKIFIEMTLEK